MNPELRMMLQALFPDAVEFRFVPWDNVKVPLWTFEDISKAVRDEGNFAKPVQLETEEVVLEPITDAGDILAGMSSRTHVVFVRVLGS